MESEALTYRFSSFCVGLSRILVMTQIIINTIINTIEPIIPMQQEFASPI